MIVFCVILTLVCSLRACHMWLTRNHMFIREIWGKFTSFIFWNFEISLVSLRRFQNFKKVNSVNLSQISLLNMWLLVEITPNAFSFFEMFILSWLMYSIDTRITITVIMTYTSYYWKSVSFSILCHWWQHKETSQLICTGKWLVYWF